MSPGAQVTCALIIRDGRLLLARREDSGLWELPGGKQEPGEELRECVSREIAEELGARVKVGRPYAAAGLGEGVKLHCFICTLTQGEPKALEHKELAWVTPEEMQTYELCPPDKAIARRLLLDPWGDDDV